MAEPKPRPKITHSAEAHKSGDAWRTSIEPIERVLPFRRNLVTQGLGGHYTALYGQSQTSDLIRQLPEIDPSA